MLIDEFLWYSWECPHIRKTKYVITVLCVFIIIILTRSQWMGTTHEFAYHRIFIGTISLVFSYKIFIANKAQYALYIGGKKSTSRPFFGTTFTIILLKPCDNVFVYTWCRSTSLHLLCLEIFSINISYLIFQKYLICVQFMGKTTLCFWARWSQMYFPLSLDTYRT